MYSNLNDIESLDGHLTVAPDEDSFVIESCGDDCHVMVKLCESKKHPSFLADVAPNASLPRKPDNYAVFRPKSRKLGLNHSNSDSRHRWRHPFDRYMKGRKPVFR